MGKPVKVYRESKTALAVFKNKNVKGKEYFIFTLTFYCHQRPPAIHLRKHQIIELKKILSQIEIAGYEEE